MQKTTFVSPIREKTICRWAALERCVWGWIRGLVTYCLRFPCLNFEGNTLCSSWKMTADRSVNINYWRWTEPSSNVQRPVSAQPSLPGGEVLPEPRELSKTEILQEDVSQMRQGQSFMVTCWYLRYSSSGSPAFMLC
jgi:hypothetical protein